MIESKLITLEISMSHNSLDHSRSSGKERNSFFHLIERRVARCRTIGMGNARQETAWFQKLHGSQRKRILSPPLPSDIPAMFVNYREVTWRE